MPKNRDKRITGAVLDQKIALYEMEDGEPCARLLQGIGLSLLLIHDAAYLDHSIDFDSGPVQRLRGGLEACEQLIPLDAFQRSHTATIAKAIDAAVELNDRIADHHVKAAARALGVLA